MKIAIASTYLGQTARGIESWARDLSAELNRRGAAVTLFRGGGPAELDYEVYLPCPKVGSDAARRIVRWTRHGGWRFGLGSEMTLQQVVFGWRLVRALRRGRFDIVHAQDAWLGRVLERASRLGLHPARVIFMHGTEETPEFLRRFRIVQEQAPWYVEQHQRNGAAGDTRWFVVPSFVDCKRFSPGDRAAARAKFGLPADRFIVLDVSALRVAYKRLDWLVRETAELRRRYPQAYLVVAGATTAETPQVEQLAREQLGEHHRLLPNVARADMTDLYRAADVVAHPSLRELFGLVFVEAMACGIPVIGHRFPVTEWIIGPGGESVDMEKAGAAAEALAKLAENPSLAAATGNAARAHALATFATEPVVDQYVAMYEKALAHS
jgi:glycosyltransferase involved in cell wall biosynthesis